MTDLEAFYGPYRAITCEWIEYDDSRCEELAVVGKSYCNHHYHKAFITATHEVLEKGIEEDLKTITTMEEKEEMLWKE